MLYNEDKLFQICGCGTASVVDFYNLPRKLLIRLFYSQVKTTFKQRIKTLFEHFVSDQAPLLAAGQQVDNAVHVRAGHQVLQRDPFERDPGRGHRAATPLW